MAFGFKIDVLEYGTIIKKILSEGLVAESDREALILHRLTAKQESLHPFEVVESLRLRDGTNPRRMLDSGTLAEWYANEIGQPYLHIDPLKVDVKAVTSKISYTFAQRHNILPVKLDGHVLMVAHCNHNNLDWVPDVEQASQLHVKPVIASPAAIRRYTMEFFQLARSILKSDETTNSRSMVSNFEQLLELGDRENVDANDQHIVNIVDWLLRYAFEQRASDIHVEPGRDKGFIRFRIDGMLHRVCDFPSHVMVAIISRCKILARMNVAEKRKPQDGRIKTRSPDGSEVELRLATLPVAFGEKLVMRIFDPDVLLKSWSELGFSAKESDTWRQLTSEPGGIVLVTGPTGSGKTTTLYSTLRGLATDDVNVCTLEDPIEMVATEFNQMQVQPNIGVDFAQGIRALMRQDPDIIMVGEIRDLETAEMAIQAALTGHLVLSTLHTNDAPSALYRLIDLGVPPYLISATVRGIMAQRLVRTLCPSCMESKPCDEQGWQAITRPWNISKPKTMNVPVGCLDCRNTGYLGRAGIYELMSITPDLQKLLMEQASLEDIRRLAYKQGMRSLRLSGARKVSKGETTIAEVMRVTPEADYRG